MQPESTEGQAEPSAGAVSVSGRVHCTCGRLLVSLGSGMSFELRPLDAPSDPRQCGTVLDCECGKCWGLVDEGRGPQEPAIRRMRVFVFDDEPSVRRLLQTVLERRGYEVFSFPGASGCLTCPMSAEERCADVIISDVRMPGLTGVEFVRQQRTASCRIEQIALLSGNWSTEDLAVARELGCAVFQKPAFMTELGRWLDDCEANIDLSAPLRSSYTDQHTPD